jgi:hypothetical protein
MPNLGDMEESPISDTAVLIAGFCLTGCLIIVIGAFIYKVWNERQMTREYHEQAVQLGRIASVLGAKAVDQFPPPESGPEAAFDYLHRHQLDDLAAFVDLDNSEPVKRDGRRRNVTKEEYDKIQAIPGCLYVAYIGLDQQVHPDYCR